MYPIRCRCGTMRQTYQDPRCRWCGRCRRGLEYPWGNVAIPEIMRGLVAVPVGGGRAWRGIGMRRQTYQNIRCRWCGGCRRDEIAVPVGGGRAWPGFETTRRAKLAARTASGRAAARRHAEQPGPTARPHSKVRRCPEHPWNHTPPSAISQNTQPAASPGGRPRGP